MSAQEKSWKFEPGKEAPKREADNDNSPPFSLLSYKEYKARRNYDTAIEVIAGLMRVGTLASINARPSKGKTGLAVNVCGALVAGDDFLGRATMPCSVAYIPVEDGNDVANRLHALGNEAIKIVEIEEGFSLGSNFKQSIAVARAIVHAMKTEAPDRIPIIVIDTLRAALEGQSVLDDRHTSPPLNALRKLAEEEGAVIIILNHTNRDNPKNSKGETLESVVAMELILIEDGDWFQLWVGKNRSGKAHYLMGKVRFTSVDNDDGSHAAIIDQIVSVDGEAAAKTADKLTGDKKILRDIILTEILDASRDHRPYGYDGPIVKVAIEEKIRKAFYKRKGGSGEARRKAFGRNMDHLLKSEWIVRDEINGEGVVWLSSRDEEAGHVAD